MTGPYKVKHIRKNRHYWCRNCNATNNPGRTSCIQCGHMMKDRLTRRMK